MKPDRSPWFQSAALRSSSVEISACGFPGATFGAVQATSSMKVERHQRPRCRMRIVPDLLHGDGNVPRERLEEMADSHPKRRSRAMTSSCASGDAFSTPSSAYRSEEHTSELQSQSNLVCRLLLEKKKQQRTRTTHLVR